MTQIKSAFTRANYLAAAGALVFAAVLAAVPLQTASAGALLDRSLMVTSTEPNDDAVNGAGEDVSSIPGHPNNGQLVGHTYRFTPYTASSLESFSFIYCNTPFGYLDDDCDGTNDPEGKPLGMDVTGVTEATVTVFDSGDTQQAQKTFTATGVGNLVSLTEATGGVPVTSGDYVVIEFDPSDSPFVNPDRAYRDDSGTPADFTHPTGTYFVNITTFSDDSYTTAVDNGTVTNAITESISITTRVQEALNFSVEGDEASDGPTATGGGCDPLTEPTALTMGDTNNALASDEAYDARSYFRLATNSSNGASVYYSGETLTSGTNTITAIGGTKAVSNPGNEQFGLAFDSAAPGYTMSQLTTIEDAYDSGNGAINGTPVAQFAFETAVTPTPALLASSSGVVQCDTGAIRYVANISPDTEAGIYTTKINYIASPAY